MIALQSSLATYRAKYQPSAGPILPRKELRPHQTNALGKVVSGLESAACRDIGKRFVVPKATIVSTFVGASIPRLSLAFHPVAFCGELSQLHRA